MLKNFLYKIHKYFIPHERNEYKPHILRDKAVRVLLLLILTLECLFLLQSLFISRSGFLASIISGIVVDRTNENRLTDHLVSLSENPILVQAAMLKAQDMANKGYFAHTSPEGLSSWYWLEKVEYQFTYAGENLAVDFSDSSEVVQAWMNSPVHRANILNEKFTEIGVAAVQGVYEGHKAVFVVQFFGRPAATQASSHKTQGEIAVEIPTSTSKNPLISEKKQATSTKQISPISAAVKGAETSFITSSIKNPANINALSPVAKIVTEPKEVNRYLYLFLGGVIFIALLLAVFVEVRVQHPQLILNGLLLLIVIAIFLVINNQLFAGGRIF